MTPDKLKDIITTTDGRKYPTRLFETPEARDHLLSQLAPHNPDITVIAGIETLGLPLASLLAHHTNTKYIQIRKNDGIPTHTKHTTQQRIIHPHNNDSLILDTRRLNETDHVYLVDDWIVTGSHINAATQLIESQNATLAAIGAIGADNPNEIDHPLNTVI